MRGGAAGRGLESQQDCFRKIAGVGNLRPKLDILPSRQRLLWDELGQTPRHFVLYGGTALALRLGHRESLDFDFFSSRPFRPLELLESIPYLRNQRATQQAENTLSCRVETAEGAVHVSFFGGLSLGQIQSPDLADSNKVEIASLLDLFGTKCVTVAQRNEAKDYLDIHALLAMTIWTLADGLAAARAIYGNEYDPMITLQALSYFDDLSEALPSRAKTDLLAAVNQVSLETLPAISTSSRIGWGGATP
jgi:hypothetical protein